MDNFKKNRLLMYSILILSLISLLITIVLFANRATYIDKQDASPSVVTSDDFWIDLYWLRLLLLTIITPISGYMLKK